MEIVQQVLQRYKNPQDIITILGMVVGTVNGLLVVRQIEDQ